MNAKEWDALADRVEKAIKHNLNVIVDDAGGVSRMWQMVIVATVSLDGEAKRWVTERETVATTQDFLPPRLRKDLARVLADPHCLPVVIMCVDAEDRIRHSSVGAFCAPRNSPGSAEAN